METGGFTPATLSALIALVRKHTGIAMTERKSVLLERRLRPRVQALNLGSYQAYLDKVEKAGAKLVSDRFLLSEDLAKVIQRAGDQWDLLTK